MDEYVKKSEVIDIMKVAAYDIYVGGPKMYLGPLREYIELVRDRLEKAECITIDEERSYDDVSVQGE